MHWTGILLRATPASELCRWVSNKMKKVCGTCLFGIDIKSELSGINVLCAYDNNWRLDRTEGCGRWREITEGLSKKEKIDLANRSIDQENTERRHKDVIQEAKSTRGHQFKLLILGFLLGIIGTIFAQYILSLWSK